MLGAIDGERKAAAKWRELAEILNTMGVAAKSGIEWKKYWDDLR